MTIPLTTATRQPTGLRPTSPATCGRWRLMLGACAVSVLAACASTPSPNTRLADAQSALAQARSNPARAELAPAEFEQANAALKRAERAWQADDDQGEVDHLALLAQRRVEQAMAAARRKETEMAIDRAGRERDAIQLGASRRQVDAAQAQAADLASRNAALEAAAAEQRQRAEALAGRLRDLQAKETERGLVVTFSDVLFDTGMATLKAGALARIAQLADVMKEYPERNVLLEGFTDSTGSEATNQQLSERRALSVRQELVARGIDARRIVTRGHADRYPIADNGTAAGRQQNRRVEAVLSDAKGELPMRP